MGSRRWSAVAGLLAAALAGCDPGSGSVSGKRASASAGSTGAAVIGSTSGGAGSSGGAGTTAGASSTAGAGSTGAGSTGGTGGTSGSGAGSTGGSICSSQRCVVYASADHDLYQVDPATNQQTHLCAFGGALTASDVVTDIAVERQGTVYGITTTSLYTIDPQTCAATQVARLSSSGQRFVGLAFTADGLLLGADASGGVFSIDPAGGQVSQVGSFGGGLACSGDLVAIDDASKTIYATAATVGCSTCTDKLVTLDPAHGYAATVVGDTGWHAVFGLGYWAGELYGFTHGGYTLQIDPATGGVSVLGNTSPTVKFSGGATTPLAPILNR